MKKFFMALMAVAAITFVGCKQQNTPDDDKNKNEQDVPQVTCTDLKLYYSVELEGKINDYVTLDVRYIEIPDSNKIGTKQNITSNWKSGEYTVEKGKTLYYGIEYTMKATDLFKEALKDEAKYKEMVATGSKLIVASCEKSTFSDGRVEDSKTSNFKLDLSADSYDAAKADAILARLETVEGWAHVYTLDENNYISSKKIENFWSRH